MDGSIGSCNGLIILATCVVSFFGFRSREFEQKYIFHPEAILAGKQYYRLVTPAFLHADWSHLLMNMFSLYLFGGAVEAFLGTRTYLAIYFGAVVGGNLLSLFVHRHHDYRAYGASGGVCGVIFAYILLSPTGTIYPWPVPLPIPAWLYAIGFLLASFYGLRAGRGNIGHDAHLGGAIIGFLIAAALKPQLVRYHWGAFILLLGVSVPLLLYLWFNPLLVPVWNLRGRRSRSRASGSDMPNYKREARQLDAILEKIGKSGVESLTTEERALLKRMSNKYRRRADSKKPDSDLLI